MSDSDNKAGMECAINKCKYIYIFDQINDNSH